MPQVSFRAKIQTIYNMDETPAYRHLKIPELGRQHCNMDEFRQHPKYRSYANSDLFLGMLRRAVKASGLKDYIRLDSLPANVTVDTSGFLAVVSINI